MHRAAGGGAEAGMAVALGVLAGRQFSVNHAAAVLQVEVLKLSWRCPWECWPAIPALRELHLVGRGPGGQFDFTTLDLESALACHGLEAIVIHSDNIFLRTRAPCSRSQLGRLEVLGLPVCYPAHAFSQRGKLHKPLNIFSGEFKLDPNMSRS